MSFILSYLVCGSLLRNKYRSLHCARCQGGCQGIWSLVFWIHKMNRLLSLFTGLPRPGSLCCLNTMLGTQVLFRRQEPLNPLPGISNGHGEGSDRPWGTAFPISSPGSARILLFWHVISFSCQICQTALFLLLKLVSLPSLKSRKFS